MRVLIAINAYGDDSDYGGPVAVARQHARLLAERGHEVTILTSDRVGRDGRRAAPGDEGTLPVVRIPVRVAAKHFSLHVPTRALRAWCKSSLQHFDVCHVHYAREAFCLAVVRQLRKARTPYFLQPHGMLNTSSRLKQQVDRVVRRQMADARACFALQPIEARRLASVSPRTRVLQLGNPAPTPASAAKPFGERSIDLLYAARFDERKRPLWFVEAVRELVREGRSVKAVMVGPDGGLLKEVQELVAQRGLSEAVEILGLVPSADLASLRRRARLLVLPSRDEPFPMAVLEACADGTPTIMTASCHIAGMFSSIDPALVAQETPEGIAASASTLLEDPHRWQAASRSVRQAAQESFSAAKIAQALESAYGDAMEVRP